MIMIKMICCFPIYVIGAVVGIVCECLKHGYEWGREEFFEG